MVRTLMDEEVLQDTEVLFRRSGVKLRSSSFLLSLLSPVFHKMVCGAFKESISKQFELDDVDEKAFAKICRLACGVDSIMVRDVMEAVELAMLADRLNMSEVLEALNQAVCRHLTVESCAEVLTIASATGLVPVVERCLSFARFRFEELAATNGFLAMEGWALKKLLDDDHLVSCNEEVVFEAVMKWMEAGEGGLRGQELLGKVRFAVMSDAYLTEVARSKLVGLELLHNLVNEAITLKSAHGRTDDSMVQHLEAKAAVRRQGQGVAWRQYEEQGQLRLKGHEDEICALVHCKGRVCSCSDDGTVRVWSRSTLELERVLRANSGDVVAALASWKSCIISSHVDNTMRVWNVASGRCLQVLEGHEDHVGAIVLCGGRLVSGSFDHNIKVWRIRDKGLWSCERTLTGHSNWVMALAVHDKKLISGSADSTMRVWAVETGELEARLDGPERGVLALLAAFERLFVAGGDGTMHVHKLGTWERLQVIVVYTPESNRLVRSLAASGSKLITGSIVRGSYVLDGRHYKPPPGQTEVLVWDADTLQCEHKFEQKKGGRVMSLLGMEGEVWAGVGNQVVVWGR